MTRKQMWLTIARAYGTSEKERTDFQYKLANKGMCDAIRILRHKKLITLHQRNQALYFLSKFYPLNKYWMPSRWEILLGYVFPVEVDSFEEATNIRCLFCCLVAQLSDKEYNGIIEGNKES